jgi:hypothetical protein
MGGRLGRRGSALPAASELGGDEAENRCDEADEGGEHGGAELDDRPVQGPELTPKLAHVLVDPVEAILHPPLEIVEAPVRMGGEIVQS